MRHNTTATKPRTTVEATTHGKRDTSFVHRAERLAWLTGLDLNARTHTRSWICAAAIAESSPAQTIFPRRPDWNRRHAAGERDQADPIFPKKPDEAEV